MGSIVSGISDIIGGNKASSASTNAARMITGAITPSIAYEQTGLTGATNVEKPFIDTATGLLPSGEQAGLSTYGAIPTEIAGATTAYNAGRPDLSPTTLYELNQMTPLFNQQMAQRGLYNSGAAVAGLSNLYANLGAQNYQQAFNNLNTATQTGLSATNPLLAAGVSTANTLGNQSVTTGANQANTMMGGTANAAGYTAQAGAQQGQGIVSAGNTLAGGLSGYFQNQGFSQGMGAGSDLQNFANNFVGDIMFAEGGRPEPGKPAIVGEKGPEVFVPDQPGTIIPNQQTGLSSVANRPPGSGLTGPTEVWSEGTANELMKARSEKAWHDEIIKQHDSMGRFSPYSDNIKYHLDRSATLAGVAEYHKAKGEADAKRQKGLSRGGK